MRLLLATATLFSLALTALAAAPGDQPSPPGPYQVIVHPKNPAKRVDRRFLEDVFLKKTTRWPDHGVIRPVDLPPESATRQRFSREVLGRSVPAVRAYWQQRIFAGRDVPPPELASDRQVVAYVLRHEGAVGYVSETADLGGTKPLVLNR